MLSLSYFLYIDSTPLPAAAVRGCCFSFSPK
jgi:hypothetical protein